MFIPVSEFIRRLAIEFPLSRAVQKFMAEMGKADPHLTKTPLEEAKKKCIAVVESVKGHGLSEEKAAEVLGVINDKNTTRDLFKYMSNLMLAGAGQKVLDKDAGMEAPDKYSIALKVLDQYQHEKFSDTYDYSALRRWLREHQGK